MSSLYEQCEILDFEREHEKIRSLLLKEFSKGSEYSKLPKEVFEELENILTDNGSGEMVDTLIEIFGSLPPRGPRDEFWSTVAARHGNLSMLRRIHENGLELDKINQISGSGIGKETPLEAGIQSQEIVEYLLSKGASPFVYNFGYYVSNPGKIPMNILKMIWEADPKANEHGVLRAFELESKKGFEWFKENGAEFSDKKLLNLAFCNLWLDVLSFLIKEKGSFSEEDLATQIRKENLIKKAQERNDSESVDKFLAEFKLVFPNAIRNSFFNCFS